MSIRYATAGAAVAAAFLSWHPSAHAQDFGSVGDAGISMGEATNTQILNNLSLDNKARGGKNVRRRTTAPLARTTYHTNPAITEKVKTQFLDWARKQNAQEAQTLQTVFDKKSPVQLWVGVAHGNGLRFGDLSDSLAAYWVLNYLMATRSWYITKPQAVAVRNQLRPVMAANPVFSRLTDAQKQELSETWMVNFLVQQAAFGQATKNGDTAQLQKLGEAAIARFQNTMHVDLRRLTLTDRGFAPKRG